MSEQVLISARNVTKSFPSGNKKRHIVVNNLSLDMFRGETLSLVGESGCGKSTFARLIMGLAQPDSGEIIYDGVNISGLSKAALKPYRRKMQMVFQDPASSLDPRMKVRDIIAEPLKVWHICNNRKEIEERVLELLEMVELKESAIDRYPHEFSGGQKQRIGIARAIAINPELLICDESVSALDVSVQAQILNLLKRLKKDLGLSCLFISHDLSVVNFISDRVCVMKDGNICEIADAESIYSNPAHEYTKYLLSAIPHIRYAE
ncbi:ATP-binding cassette domain-containing protein [Butyrivibrio sp. AE3004]|uniref:ATP-binding cassette domain-containing protein n=1 Tax=Butyrivibrio sp. AE3004 TaxID=1506994 RepID=UPI0006923F86|nr:ATP-binding cassette domain-containing protein [Butyrivibrio sp. AE3004]